MKVRSDFDTIVIGGGPAGLSAALWCDELGLATLLLEQDEEFGGQLRRVYNLIGNHLGSDPVDGPGLRDRFVRQTAERGFSRKSGTSAIQADLQEMEITLYDGETVSARSVVIATGVRRRRAGAEGEEDFAGRGVIESGKKDAKQTAGKLVLIVGGGDAALENALILAEHAEKVYVVHRRATFTAREEFMRKAKNSPNIEFLIERRLQKIFGGERVEGVELANTATDEIETLAVDVVLIRIGVEPNSEIFKDQIETDNRGYIVVNSRCETSVEGVFAVGDVANPASPTVSTAVGMGATAAKAAHKYLASRPKP